MHTCWSYDLSLSICDGSGDCRFEFNVSRALNLSDPMDHSRIQPSRLRSQHPLSFFRAEDTIFVRCPGSTFHTRKHYIEPHCGHSPQTYRPIGEFEMFEAGAVQWDKIGGDTIAFTFQHFVFLPRDYVFRPEAYLVALRDNGGSGTG
jgi:hypothetical protein